MNGRMLKGSMPVPSGLFELEQHPEIWRDGQARLCFDNVLENEDLAKPGRYGRFAEAMRAFGAVRVKTMGVAAATESVKLPEGKSRDRFVAQVTQAAVDRGMPISGQQARVWRMQLTLPSAFRTPCERKTDHISVLEQEVMKLRARNRELEAQVRKLEREIAKLCKRKPASGSVVQPAPA